MKNNESIKIILQDLKTLYGLEFNANKSTLFFSKGASNKQHIADSLNINIGNLPTLYLDIPLSNNILKAMDFGWLMDKINKKSNH